MKQKEIEKKHITKLEAFTQRYRRTVGDIDPKKVSCTLKMRVSYKKCNEKLVKGGMEYVRKEEG